jgi:predicted SnoaL-like aldol condensation-catalyzing enzyme
VSTPTSADTIEAQRPDGADSTRDGVTAKLSALFAENPDAVFHLDAVVAAGDRVATLSTLEGVGALTRFADFYALRAGQITDHWHVVAPLPAG